MKPSGLSPAMGSGGRLIGSSMWPKASRRWYWCLMISWQTSRYEGKMANDRPLLEIVTRHMVSRPRMFAANQESIMQLSANGHLKATTIIDDQGRGMAWAQSILAEHKPAAEYVWILDDDDTCIRPSLVEELALIADEYDPEVVMLRMDIAEIGTQPDDAHWGRRPVHSHVGVSCYIIRRDVWMCHRHVWSEGLYDSDFHFIDAVFEADPVVYWHDVVASMAQRISRGRAE